MRVAIFYTPCDPKWGGGYTYQDDIFQSLLEVAESSPHTFVVFSGSKAIAEQQTAVGNLEFVFLQTTYLGKALGASRQLLRLIRRKLRHPFSPFDLRTAYKNYWLNRVKHHAIDVFWSLGPGQLVLDIPYIATVWDLQHRLQPFFPEVSAAEQWQQRESAYATVLRRAAYVIVGTAAGKQEVVRFYGIPAERVRVLPHPTPRFALNGHSADPTAVLNRYDLKADFLFYPAQFWPHKNHASLLRAARLLRERYDILLDLVFVGSDKGNLQYIRTLTAKLKLSDRVHFLGFVPSGDLVALYKSAFALTYASYFGPDNLPPLEAFALACPVIASRVSGAEEQLGDAALLFDPRNPEQLADAIRMLHGNPDLRAELVRRGRERALRFTGKDYVQGVFGLLDEFEPFRSCWRNTGPYHQL
ncbi:MAG: glycosyltransferase family 1 protein [bacterium]|nr:glycosyltransferase family 1 protein [bacterium]